MENKTSRHISERELDGLLKEAFLGLDFETNQLNKKALERVGTYTLRRNSFLRLFSSNRMNFLLLILSAFIFLNSFYRYLEPLMNKDTKKYEPVLGISAFIKNDIPVVEKTATTIPQAVEETKTEITPKKSEFRHNKIKPLVVIETEKTDSVLISKPKEAESDSNETVSKIRLSDSLAIPKMETKPPVVLVAEKKIRPERKVTQKISNKKGKSPKVRKGSRFRKNGTFIMKGGRYGKSRKIQR